MSAQARLPRDLSHTPAYTLAQRWLEHQIQTAGNHPQGAAGVASFLLEIPDVFPAVSVYLQDEIEDHVNEGRGPTCVM